jgi:hypothetical protein
MRMSLALLLVVHGLLHLLGAFKWLHIAPIPQLSGRTLVNLSSSAERVFGALWLLTCLLLLLAAALQLTRLDGWWRVALIGVLLSQSLIVLAWQDARFGSFANVMLLLAALAGAGHARFARNVDAEIDHLLSSVPPVAEDRVQARDLQQLPALVQKWLVRSKVVGQPRVHSVRLRQRGQLRTAPNAAWLPASADQYFRTDEPAFVWRVQSRMFGLPVEGRDRYDNSGGEMLIRIGSLFDVVRANDEKIALGAQLRFLGEIVWFPSAALNPMIRWQALGEDRVRATLTHAGRSSSATFVFDELGRVMGLQAERYMGSGDAAQLTPWAVSCTQWQTLAGVEVPTRGDVSWQLPAGDFSYYQWEITELEFNRDRPWSESGGT